MTPFSSLSCVFADAEPAVSQLLHTTMNVYPLFSVLIDATLLMQCLVFKCYLFCTEVDLAVFTHQHQLLFLIKLHIFHVSLAFNILLSFISDSDHCVFGVLSFSGRSGHQLIKLLNIDITRKN